MKMVLKFYGDLLSQPSRAVWIFLKLNNIPFELVTIRLIKGEQRNEEYVKIFPHGKVPAINHDGFLLTESVAILRYLAREYCVPDHWYPKDSKQQAKVDEYMSWQHLNARQGGLIYYRNKHIFPILTGSPVNESKVKEGIEMLEKALNDVENIFLAGDKAFLCGNEISIADLLAISELKQPASIGYDIAKNRPKLAEWMKRVDAKIEPYYKEAFAVLDSTASLTCAPKK